VFPLACLKRIEKLRFVGLIALIAIFSFTMIITYHFVYLASQGNLDEGVIFGFNNIRL
jgi:amino acid permease